MSARWIGPGIGLGAAVLALLVWSSVLTLGAAEIAVVSSGGKWRVLCDRPGLCWYRPLQHPGIVEQRQQWLRLSGESLGAVGAQTRLVDVALVWHVSDVQRYLAAVGGSMGPGAEQLRVLLRAALPGLDLMNDSTAGGAARQQLIDQAGTLGISIGEPQLLRAELTEHESEETLQVAGAAIKARAQAIREQGERDNLQLRAAGEHERDVQQGAAARDAGKIRGAAEAEAARIYARAYGKDPQFADFFRSLEAYKRVLGREGDLLVITPDGDFFRYLQKPAAR